MGFGDVLLCRCGGRYSRKELLDGYSCVSEWVGVQGVGGGVPLVKGNSVCIFWFHVTAMWYWGLILGVIAVVRGLLGKTLGTNFFLRYVIMKFRNVVGNFIEWVIPCGFVVVWVE